jgi:hypothetical protein
VVGTAIVPLVLKPGDDASREMFEMEKDQDPLKKKSRK